MSSNQQDRNPSSNQQDRSDRNPSMTSLLPPPSGSVVWFRATDIPLRDATPFHSKPGKGAPQIWEPFWTCDSKELEVIYQNLKSDPSSGSKTVTPIMNDGLFEVNVATREIYPIYWDGPVYEVRRGVWFEPKGIHFEIESYQKGSNYTPCDENLTTQLEDGLKKFSQIQISDTMTEKEKAEWRWPLLGPYLSEMVSYDSSILFAWMQSDYLASKIQRTLLQSSGKKLIRGWDEVVKLQKKTNTPASKSTTTTTTTTTEGSKDAPPKATAEPALEEPETTEMRKINHIIFVIHGIGQKLSHTIGAGLTFVNDCDQMRSGIMDCSKIYKESLKGNAESNQVPNKGGVQVIPIHWRQRLNVTNPAEQTDEDEDVEITLGDIMPDGIPGIRMLISDVILDVLLYMTPKYRREMINHVSSELNRLYSLFMDRNPTFNGSVSIYGHSLGSVIAFDIATHQHYIHSTGNEVPSTPIRPNSAGVDLTDLLFSGTGFNSKSGPLIEESALDAPKLIFDINALFAVGSPIGMFLFLSGIGIKPPLLKVQDVDPSDYSARPLVKSLFNIYHVYDPVAHRLEPLFASNLTSLRPYLIPYTKGGLTSTVKGLEQASSEVLQKGKDYLSGIYASAFNSFLPKPNSSLATPTKSSKDVNQPEGAEGDVKVSTGSLTERGGVDSMADGLAKQSLTNIPKTSESKLSPTQIPRSSESKSSPSNIRRSSETKVSSVKDRFNKARPVLHADPTEKQQSKLDQLKELNPHGRLDFMLQESLLENSYISSLGAHLQYWSDSDVNSLILKVLYDIPLP